MYMNVLYLIGILLVGALISLVAAGALRNKDKNEADKAMYTSGGFLGGIIVILIILNVGGFFKLF